VIFGFEESSRPVFVNVRVGSTLPMLRTAAGQIFAAFLPDNQTRDLIRSERESAGAAAATLPSESAWTRQLDSVRKRGLASVTGDLFPGINAVAAPVFNDKGRLAAVIGALGRSEDIDVRFDGAVANAVRGTAAEISRRIGYLE